MWLPPDAPITILTFPSVSLIKTEGHIEDIGRFPGLMKLAGDAGIPK